MIDVSVVVPVYCSEATLRRLVERIRKVFASLEHSYEIILVDDGSTDDSWDVIRGLHSEHGEVLSAVQLMRNCGQHNALMCGFRNSRGRFVITMDDDMQNPPEEIPKLITAIEQSTLDVIYGRYLSKQHAFGRNLGSQIVNAFYRRIFHLRATVSSFRVIRREVIECILPYSLNYTFIDGLLAWNTQRIGDVEVEHHPRREGRSGYSIMKLITLAMNLFTSFSVVPLHLASAMGFVAAAGGIVVGLYYVLQYLLSNIIVPGYASTIIAVLVLGGLQLLSLGVIGEYVGRMHLNINRKPQYSIRRVIHASNNRLAEQTEPAQHSLDPGRFS